ncbi:TetR family transcriptional regulator [Anaerobacillus arseniciselenatis]|uniref:TetR family transcriptional regulator n=1 Tax=Anaerobacillus arseniciselenatis TaxID=85682 RepID=A0A1S2LJZ8_9BACI|nr:TetR/AcrR family transcriptional regulator [Anaerobacillus arseniciselenatis]OIJ12842.1 TetR family transcriptional regulator [Anaerobacillus arseniciselenatis]
MPPKKKFSKQQIVDAAFDIARTEGIDNITIRKVAEKLGSSIAPIYVNFKDVDELIEEVVNKIFAVSQQLLQQENSGRPFRDIGVASIRFAKHYSVLFKDLVMNQNKFIKKLEQGSNSDIIELMKQDADLKGFTDEELQEILLKMKIFQTGLSIMVANELLPDEFNEEKMIEILESTANDVIAAAHLNKKED